MSDYIPKWHRELGIFSLVKQIYQMKETADNE